MMAPPAPRPHRNYSFILSIAGGALVTFDYTLDLIAIASILSSDSAVLAAVPWVLLGLACGLVMIASAYLAKSSSDRKWPYALLGSSLLTLFLPYLTVISAVGGVLGSAASTYLLSRRRMQPTVKDA
jgi:uncharacterized membrane protein